MIRVEAFNGGLFHYEVSGEQESEAAAELDKTLRFYERDLHTASEYVLQDIADKRAALAEKYGVEIRSALGD